MNSKIKTLTQFITKGQYDYANSDINDKNFPDFESLPNEKTELVHPNITISNEDAIKNLKERGMRPANLKEVLQFGIDFPEKQREFSIVALGSVGRDWRGRRSVACLWGGSGRRRLDLDYFGLGWSGDYRFLGVRLDSNIASPCENKEHLNLESRVSKIESWLDKWEGIGEGAYDSGWVEYRKKITKQSL